MITWTIGAGGLLGASVQAACANPFAGVRLPWLRLSELSASFAADLSRFRKLAGDEPWAIVWAAGAATVSTHPDDTARELNSLECLLGLLREEPPRGQGAFFLSSSAGGVYAGSSDPPFDVDTAPAPLSAYGQLKLDQEAVARSYLVDTCPVLIGRISNLYGPGQNLDKLQGLVSRLALTAATRQPLNIFVPLDTMRDYLYMTDAAALIHDWVEQTARGSVERGGIRIIASGESVTVGQLITTMHLVTKRRIPLALGSHASAQHQALDLRLTPTYPAERAGITLTPLPVGMKRVFLDIVDRLQRNSLTETQSR